MRVVFDTNVLISALIFRKHLGGIETMIKHGDSTPCFIPATFQEFQNVLEYQKLHAFMQASNVTPKQIIVAVTKKNSNQLCGSKICKLSVMYFGAIYQ